VVDLAGAASGGNGAGPDTGTASQADISGTPAAGEEAGG
jgi:hypothetical protein